MRDIESLRDAKVASINAAEPVSPVTETIC
jgi:hypothetical protein